MQPLRVTILCYVEAPDAQPDVVVPQVQAALTERGHTVSVVTAHDDLEKLIQDLRASKPDVIFNLLEQLGTKSLGSDVAAVGVLDLLGFPYTGGGPGEFYLSGEKGLSKKVLAFEGVNFPKFAVFSKDADFETGGNLRMPLFVKPLRMDASIGIDAGGLVHSAGELMKRVVYIHETCDDAALAEEYIEGREVYVAIIGNVDPQALPAIEMDFSGFPEGKPKIMDARAKFDESSPEFQGTRPVIAELPPELDARVKKAAIQAYRALKVRDYGRVDMRIDDTGEIYVLEVNASCYLESGSELSIAARAAGMEYPALVEKILELAMARQGVKVDVSTVRTRR